MKRQIPSILIILILCLVAIGLGYYLMKTLFHGNVGPQALNKVTDTIYRKVYVHDTLPNNKKEREAPTQTTQYLDKFWVQKYTDIKEVNDSLLVVISKGHRDTVQTKYVTEFIKEPKIVLGRFTRDSIRLDKLLIDGTIYSEQYGTDYQHFGYEFTPGSSGISRFKTQGDNIPRRKGGNGKISTTGFVYGAYHPQLPAFSTGGTILLGFNRVGLRGNGDVELFPNLKADYSVGIYYKLW